VGNLKVKKKNVLKADIERQNDKKTHRHNEIKNRKKVRETKNYKEQRRAKEGKKVRQKDRQTER
jgi:hypothetical protein